MLANTGSIDKAITSLRNSLDVLGEQPILRLTLADTSPNAETLPSS